MNIIQSLDIEDEIRKALKGYYTIYCRPLPENFTVPSLLITVVGGEEIEGRIDAFDVVLDARAETDAEAMDILLEATAILRAIAEAQVTPLRYIVKNSIAAWGNDPVRPELKLCSSRMTIYCHKIVKQFNKIVTIKTTVTGDRTLSELPKDYSITGYKNVVLTLNDPRGRHVVDDDGQLHEIKFNTNGNEATWTIGNVKAGENITFTQNNYDIEGYIHTGAETQTITVSDENTVNFANNYEQTQTLIITTTATGEQTLENLPGDYSINENNLNVAFTLNDPESREVIDPDGIAHTVTMAIDGNTATWTIDNLTNGTELTLTQNNYDIEGYTHTGETTQTIIISRENVVNFDNYYEEISQTLLLTVQQLATGFMYTGNMPNNNYINVIDVTDNNSVIATLTPENKISGTGTGTQPNTWEVEVETGHIIDLIEENIDDDYYNLTRTYRTNTDAWTNESTAQINEACTREIKNTYTIKAGKTLFTLTKTVSNATFENLQNDFELFYMLHNSGQYVYVDINNPDRVIKGEANESRYWYIRIDGTNSPIRVYERNFQIDGVLPTTRLAAPGVSITMSNNTHTRERYITGQFNSQTPTIIFTNTKQ